MTDPPRLLDVESDELARSILEFGARELPAPAVRRRVQAAAAAAAAVAVVTPLAAAPVAAKSLVASLVTWTGVGLVAGAVTSGAVVLVSGRSPESSQSAADQPGYAVVNTPAERPPPPREVAGEQAVPVDTRSENAPSTGAPAMGGPATMRAPVDAGAPANTGASLPAPGRVAVPRGAAAGVELAGDPLQRELALLDRARRALQRGDVSDAMAALDAHAERGVLAPEARVLRIEALLMRGDRATARRLAERFLADDARSTHANRVRTLLGASE